MKRFSSATLAAAVLTLGLSLASVSAYADTTTNINISSQYAGGSVYPSGSWTDAINGNTIAAAPTNGNTGTGITFTDWDGHFSEIDPNNSRTFSFTGVALTADSVVNTLINTFYGDSGTDSVITFTNSLNQTVQYSLVGDQTVRDYNNAIYANDLQGFNTAGGLGAVTAQNWWNNGSGQRLDVQTFVLPSSWNGTSLVSMNVATPVSAGADNVVSALQVVTSTASPIPEPSSLVLLGTGLIGVVGTVRRRIARNS